MTSISAWRRALLFFAVPVIAPVAFIGYIISHYGVNLVYSDEWNMVPLLQKASAGELGFTDLWQQSHSLHRLFFPEIVVGSIAYLTHWNVKVEMFMDVELGLITAWLIYLLLKDSVRSRVLAFVAMALAALWLFSPVQSESWLWGWDITWFMSITAATTVIYLISRMSEEGKRSWIYLGGAIAAGVMAMYTFGPGHAIWPVGLAMLLVQKQKRKVILIWCGAAVVAFAAYYYNFNTSAGAPPLFAFVTRPINTLSYFFILFGRLYTQDLQAARLLGAINLSLLIPALSLVWLQRKQLTRFVPWLATILFTLLCAFMIILARLSPILTDAAQSRYTAISIFYIVGLIGLIFTLVDSFKPSKLVLRYVVLVALVIQLPLLASSYAIGIKTSKATNVMMGNVRLCAIQKVPSDNCLHYNNYFSTPSEAREQLNFLKERHWGGY